MKKVFAIIAVVAFALIAQADFLSRTWDTEIFDQENVGAGNETTPSYEAAVLSLPTVDGSGLGWQIDVFALGASFDYTEALDLSGANTAGWYDGYGYYTSASSFTADEGQNVMFRIWNNADSSVATWYLDSLSITLADLDDLEPPNAELSLGNVVDFTGQSWQAVPEPATAMLLALGGGLAWLVRLKQRIAA